MERRFILPKKNEKSSLRSLLPLSYYIAIYVLEYFFYFSEFYAVLHFVYNTVNMFQCFSMFPNNHS